MASIMMLDNKHPRGYSLFLKPKQMETSAAINCAVKLLVLFFFLPPVLFRATQFDLVCPTRKSAAPD